jgi:hypothetical protein
MMRKRNWKCSWTCAVLLAMGSSAAWQMLAAQDRQKRRQPPAYAVVSGSVFQESGFLLRGARVLVTNTARPKDRKETVTDMQGEFAVRLPAGQATYAVEVSAKGFVPERKEVQITADERISLTFRLALAPE